MKLGVEITLRPERPSELVDMIRQFNTACNWLSGVAFEERLFHWYPLQKRCYYELRQRFGLKSKQAIVAIRKVADCYVLKERRNKQALIRPYGSVPLYRHSYRRPGWVSFFGFNVPYVTRRDIALPTKPAQGVLVLSKGVFRILQAVDVPEPPAYKPSGFLGLDLGIVNILTDSDGLAYSGAKLNNFRRRHVRLRTRLVSKRTRSARRLLLKRLRKEGRFARDTNHVISKQVVAKAQRHRLGIALETLEGIRKRTTVRRAHRRQQHSWSFRQLAVFLTYKAVLAGVPVVTVHPRNTSRTCPSCGLVDKHNRRTRDRFLCVGCGFGGPADAVAAENIRRAACDQPYAAPVRRVTVS